MPSASLRDFRADFAAKLDQLETATAVLERDARRRHARLVELGLAPRTRRSLVAWSATAALLFAAVAAAHGKVMRAVAEAKRAAYDPRAANAVRIAWGWGREVVTYLALAFALLIPFAVGILLLAPPD